ncbi:predicted protein [Naegleria gruberi]|uniref:Predicted protein n=1 Tax=Naegleria gruberi TaxID=5762 RepID=D2VMQ0_NAEGR|nr:uncharacterized protein NAEGRDRAFT_50822 [Naegleria gruberi]EFC41772.1 predicted protein [Naegleria gruberi]|eukprot:XP_002674516.1 predicted protein [Naegleria gruberi strain NEG-M]
MPIEIKYSHTKEIALTKEHDDWQWSTGEGKKLDINYGQDQKLQTIQMTTKSEGDYWRITHYDFIHDDGDFLYLKSLNAQTNQNFEIQVSFKANYQNLYDQAGIMLRSGEKHWMKTGIEYVHGTSYASAVVTREYSDWSTNPLEKHNTDDYFTIKVQLFKGDVRVDYSLDEGKTFHLLRIAHLFDQNESHPLQLGIFAASPTRKEGCQVEFKNLSITELIV